MRAERLFRALGLVDPALVEEALEVRRRVWKRWAAMAACLALMIGLGFGWLGGWRNDAGGTSSGGASGDTGSAAGGEAGGSGGPEEGAAFMSYAGPVMPLTALERPEGLMAERTVTWDFAPGDRQWGAEVTDACVLRNSTEEDIAVTALYPFAGTLDGLTEFRPRAAVDGEAVETVLYSGGVLPADGGWTDYRALLERGPEQDAPVLDIPAVVYEFSDFAAPLADYPAATQAVSLHAAPEKTTILTYGFDGMEWDGSFRRYSYFVSGGTGPKLLIVLGEDFGAYELQGYQDGGCDSGEELEGVRCSAVRRETTLDAVLDRLCRDCLEGREGCDGVPFQLYRRAAAELLVSGGAGDCCDGGRLDELLAETLSRRRILYLAFPVTVPAGGGVRVECGLWKAPSFDFCSSENLQGYDLLTASGLTFTRQRAVLVNGEGIEITGQNFGFGPEGGAVDIEREERCFLELRPREG